MASVSTVCSIVLPSIMWLDVVSLKARARRELWRMGRFAQAEHSGTTFVNSCLIDILDIAATVTNLDVFQ